MLTGIDHLVVVVPDLARGAQEYADLGFAVSPGGRHPTGSRNALIGLADGAYIELLVFDAPSPQHRWWKTFQRSLREGACLADFCVSTEDLEGDVRALRAAGVRMGDPQPGSRLRPDGYTVNWVLSIPPAEHAAVVPFLIKDVTPREERVPRDQTHSNRVTGIDTLTVATDEPAQVRQWFAGLLPPASVRDVTRDDLDAAGLRLTIGPHAVEYLRPRGPSSPLHAWLRDRGPFPYAATLSTPGGAAGGSIQIGR